MPGYHRKYTKCVPMIVTIPKALTLIRKSIKGIPHTIGIRRRNQHEYTRYVKNCREVNKRKSCIHRITAQALKPAFFKTTDLSSGQTKLQGITR